MMKKIKEIIEKYGLLVGGITLISSGIAFGFSTDFIQFLRYFVLSLIGLSGGYWWFTQKKRVDERVQTLETMLGESDGVIREMEEVIEHYEEMIDTALVKIPCVCGKNTFEGIFAMNVPNEVVCEKCSSKYQITVKPESILITEPIEDLNISKLIEEESEKYDKN